MVGHLQLHGSGARYRRSPKDNEKGRGRKGEGRERREEGG